ncbi:MAG: MmcQ/YjbR family DNA-binding protein [Chloroflexi bacterium]|nr:MmcQ/YjbR family DNA-binding protein [Chloroflexota bacterium]
MSSWEDVRRIALALPETTEGTAHGNMQWAVNKKGFVWERPLRKSDLEALGERAPKGPILGVHVEHLGIKDVLLESNPDVYFTTPHFDGYPSVLVRLERIDLEELQEVITDAWLARAPTRLTKQWLAQHRGAPGST